MSRALLACTLAFTATLAAAIDAPQWPPASDVESHMRELQDVLGARESTAAQREAAREELSGLLKSPAGQSRGRTADEKPARPAARAAIDPLPGIVKPAYSPPIGPAPPLAHVEVVQPPKPWSMPSRALPLPSSSFAVDPRTGAVLHEIAGGYVNPLTGQVTAR